jgi:glycosyltransferase involved in cell wall biosynthesis
MRTVHEINLQRHFGGGEVYTRFLSNALVEAGWPVELYVHNEAAFWDRLDMPGVRLVRMASLDDIAARLPAEKALVMTHNVLDREDAAKWAARHTLTGFAHMPLFDRDPAGLPHYRRVFCVSQHVIDSAHAKGLQNTWPEPLYGVADLQRGATQTGEIRRGTVYDWDRRKVRDRLLGWLYPLSAPLRTAQVFQRRPGLTLTLGIVSRLTPIKQFPLLFRHLSPVIAKFPSVNIEIFGSGGYASVRDLRRALQPIAQQVRFWGYQQDVKRVYAELDYVLSGLPEKEALGLNLIEAQSCGTPVLAVNAPPFTETVLDGESGHLFTDPRTDGGKNFAELLAKLTASNASSRPNLRGRPLVDAHLELFSEHLFRTRLAAAMADLG